MFLKLFLTGLIATVTGDSSIHELFDNYVNDYNKNYDTNEYNYRFSIFKENYNYIENRNNLSRPYTLGLNNFTDISKDEFKHLYLSQVNINYKKQHHYPNNLHKPIPKSIDWRAAGVVTDVKNQGQCGSCWAFSAIGTIEGQHAKQTGNLVSLSEQNLVDCSTVNYGCGGGWPDKAMQYVVKNGIDTEASYPYEAVDDTCEYNVSDVGANITGVVDIPSKNMSDLYHAIGLIGPISIAIDVEDDFQFYHSGIYESTECNDESLDHAVLAVGYSSFNSTPFIIVKNSWGTDWGMDGYIYMSTHIYNMCGMATAASYPLV